MLASLSDASAQVVYDRFETPGRLAGQTPMLGGVWTSVAGETYLLTQDVGPYSGVATGPGVDEIVDSSFSPIVGKVVYVGFHLQLDSIPTSGVSAPVALTGLNVSERMVVARVVIAPGSEPGRARVGIDNGSGISTFWTQEIAPGEAVRVVVGFSENGTSDVSKLWINPVGISSDSIETSAAALVGEISGVRINAGNSSNGWLRVDNLVVTEVFDMAANADYFAYSFAENSISLPEGGSVSAAVLALKTLENSVSLNATMEADPSLLPFLYVSSGVTFFPGFSSTGLYMSLSENDVIDGPRSFQVRLTAPAGSPEVLIGPIDVLTVNVVDNELPGEVFFAKHKMDLHEADGSVLVNLKRHPNDTGEVSLRVRTVDGTALAGIDYQAFDSIVTLPDGVIEKTVRIFGIESSPDIKPPRSFSVELSEPAPGTRIKDPSSCTITTNDKDDAGSAVLNYTVPDPEALFRFVDLALDAEGTLYGLAHYSLGQPSKLESRVIKFDVNGVGQTFCIVPTGSPYVWASDIEFGPDGSLYVAGGRVHRYFKSGLRDASYNSPPAELSRRISVVLPLGDGKVIAGGNIPNPASTSDGNRIVRLNPDGTIDPTFTSPDLLPGGTTNWIYDLALDSQGRLLICGSFTSVQGQAKRLIARLQQDGGLDASFTSGPIQGTSISSLETNPNGTFFAAGAGGIRKLLADGAIDSSFAFGVNRYEPVTQPDGKVLCTEYSFPSITRVTANGTVDPEFRGSTSISPSILLGPDGRIHVAGQFTLADNRPAPMISTLSGGLGSAGGTLQWSTSTTAVGESIGTTGAWIQRSGSSYGTVGVHYDLVLESAGAGDVTTFKGYAVFGPGETARYISFDVQDDNIAEGSEHFHLVLHNPDGGALVGIRTSLSVQIVDDDGSEFAPWLARHFPESPSDQTLLAEDSDGDGVSNLAEYMTGSLPGSPGDAKLSSAQVISLGADRHGGIRFYIDSNKTEFRVQAERASSLNPADWVVIWDSSVDPDLTSPLIQNPPENGTGWVTIRSPHALGKAEFLRLRYSPR